MSPALKNIIKGTSIVVIFTLILVLNLTDSEHRLFYRFPMKVIAIPVYIFGKIKTKIEDMWRGYIYLVNSAHENRLLKEELTRKELEIGMLKEKLREFERLKALIGYREKIFYSTLVARVIGFSPDSSRSFIIDEGKEGGVKVGMPVISYGGLVGMVVEVGRFYSKVLLLTDPNIRVDVKNIRTREKSVLLGKGDGMCVLLYYPVDGEVREGDAIITAGTTEFFPPGIPVGVVSAVKDKNEIFKEVIIKPWVNFSSIEEVLVVLKK